MRKSAFKNQSVPPHQAGIIHPYPLIMLAAVGLVIYFLVSQTFPFKNTLLNLLYPKQSSNAETITDSLPCQLPDGSLAPGVCTGFNEVSGPNDAPMQNFYNNLWDIRVSGPDPVNGPNTISMDTGCTQLGDPTTHYKTYSDSDMMSMMCGWHMMSAVNDGTDTGGTFAWISWRGRSQFDFTNRTGTVFFTFDWKETARQFMNLVISPDKSRYPSLGPVDGGMADAINNGISLGFSLNLSIDVARNGVKSSIYSASAPSSVNNTRNKIVVKISSTQVTVTKDGTLVVDRTIDPPLTFSKGFITFNQANYNFYKDCAPGDPIHDMDCKLDTIHWDNIGWDGPITNFAVASTDNQLQLRPGPSLQGVTLNLPTGGPGLLWFNAYGVGNTNGQYRINSGTWKTLPASEGFHWRTFALPETFQSGNNLVEFRSIGSMNGWLGDSFAVDRIDLEVPLASGSTPLPTSAPTPFPTTTSTPTPTPTSVPTPTPLPTIVPTPTPVPTPLPTPVPTPIPTPIPTPSPLPSQQVGSTIRIYAAGTQAKSIYPTIRLQLRLNGTWTTVQTYTNVTGNPATRVFNTYIYNSSTRVNHQDVRVRFANDYYDPQTGQDRNLVVDKINIDGIDYQSEAPTVYSVGSWDPTNGCKAGFKSSEWLMCNGYFEYR